MGWADCPVASMLCRSLRERGNAHALGAGNRQGCERAAIGSPCAQPSALMCASLLTTREGPLGNSSSSALLASRTKARANSPGS